VFPADSAARIDAASVKSGDFVEMIEGIESIRDLESFLRDAGGLSKGAAVALVARVKKVMGVVGEPGPGTAETKALSELQSRLVRIAAIGA
jgi:hypothetical protein